MTMESQFAAVGREPRLPDKVAGEMQRSILTGVLKPGDRLPTERELGEQFGVSRTVIREAVRSLVAKGLLEVRGGSGVRVATVDASHVRETMGMYLRVNGEVGYGNLHEVRAVLEIEVAGRAAQRADDDDVERLRTSTDEMEAAIGDVERVSVLDVEFHRLLAQATHNGLFVVMLDSIGDILLDVRRATMGIPDRPARGLKFHRQILDRVAAHDRNGARKAMRAHLDDSEAAWQGLSEQETEHVIGA
jgi:GntR family transcriptional repressor for pyruvate dehydrogenase complex